MQEEPKELDSDNEAVASMHDGIKRILSQHPKAAPRKSLRIPDHEKHILHCARILKLDAERRLIVIVVEKKEGGLRQIRIEASED